MLLRSTSQGLKQASKQTGCSCTPLTWRLQSSKHVFGHRASQPAEGLQRRVRLAPCQATIDDPEIKPLVDKMEQMRPPPLANHDMLKKAIELIDEANSKDPSQVPWEGARVPYRLLYSQWVTDWVNKLDPKASDELLILARGRQVDSWRLSEIKRDDYAPNAAGERQWQLDRKKALANRLTGLMQQAGYGEASTKLVEEVMLNRDIPDPRDIRQHDLVAPLGNINFRLLEEACMIQTLRDADALVFMEKSFPQMFARLDAEETLLNTQEQLKGISNKCMAIILGMNWTPVQRKLVAKAFPAPRRIGSILKDMEGVASASSHPGDWRYRNFDYE